MSEQEELNLLLRQGKVTASQYERELEKLEQDQKEAGASGIKVTLDAPNDYGPAVTKHPGATDWERDPHGYLIIRKGTEKVATYAPGGWKSVERVTE